MSNQTSQRDAYSNATTLDEMHRKRMQVFQKNRELLPKIKKQLARKIDKLKIIEGKNPSDFTNDDIRNKSRLKTKIDKLEDKIYDIEYNVTELDYLRKTSDVVIKYYNILETYQGEKELDSKLISLEDSQKLTEQHDKLKSDNNKQEKKSVKKRGRHIVENTTRSLENYMPNIIKETNKKGTADYFNIYKKRINHNFVNDNKTLECEKCKIEKVLMMSQGAYTCIKCGHTEYIVVESEKPNYNDNIPEKPSFPYKRSNHLGEWLAQFQGKESIEIPVEVYEKLCEELRKERITNIQEITPSRMRKLLSKIDLTKYYEHAIYIISKLSGLPPPSISRETEDKIKYMFDMVQEPFEKYCPPLRINFLNYSFILHKFFQLLDLDEYLMYFPLLKSRDKLREQDNVWKNICKDLRWQFIPSI